MEEAEREAEKEAESEEAKREAFLLTLCYVTGIIKFS